MEQCWSVWFLAESMAYRYGHAIQILPILLLCPQLSSLGEDKACH